MYTGSKRKTLSVAMVADRYKLKREIAQGGMGTVWLAQDIKLGRLVAVKVMAQELARMSEAQARFEREALAVAQLRSAHVVQVYDYGVQEGLPFIVMELLDGESLGDRLKRVRRIPLLGAVPIIKQIAKGLKAAHGASLIHRDLKPSNIFISRHDDEEVIKLLDFGVVKAAEHLGSSEDSTSTGMLLGTPQYMSPEQARGIRGIDHRSDLWSFGVIIFRMLTGTNPFKGDNVGDVVLKICSDELPNLAEVAPDLTSGFGSFFERAFARAPSARFQSAEELASVFLAVTATQVSHPSAIMPNPLFVSGEQPVLQQPMVPPPAVLPPPPAMPAMPVAGPYTASAPPPASTPNPLATPPARSAVSSQNLALFAPGLLEPPTPVSTTVGGTQVARPTAKSFNLPAVALIAGGVGTLVIGGLLGLFWMMSGTTAPAAGPAASASATVAPVERDAGAAQEGRDETVADGDTSATPEEQDAGGKQPPATKPTAAPTRVEPQPTKQPPAKSDTARPKWF